jgi:hypothetical protein
MGMGRMANFLVGFFPSMEKPVVVLLMQHWSGIAFTLQRTNTENSKQIFPEKELHSHSPDFHIHVSLSDLYIPTIDLSILLQEIYGPNLGTYKSLTGTLMC